jgi:hypothetical protein
MQLLDARAGQHRPPDPEVVPTCLVAARRDTNQQLGNAVLVLNLSLYIRGLHKCGVADCGNEALDCKHIGRVAYHRGKEK